MNTSLNGYPINVYGENLIAFYLLIRFPKKFMKNINIIWVSLLVACAPAPKPHFNVTILKVPRWECGQDWCKLKVINEPDIMDNLTTAPTNEQIKEQEALDKRKIAVVNSWHLNKLETKFWKTIVLYGIYEQDYTYNVPKLPH